MDYNLAGLRQRVVIDLLDDEEYEPGVVDRFLNDAQRDIYNQFELPFQEEIFKGTIPAGSTMFKLPNDVALIQSQSVKGSLGFTNRQMKWRDFFRRYDDIDNSPPSAIVSWTLYAGNVLLSAPTDQDYEMTIFYIKKPKVLKLAADVPQIPEEFSELLLLGALMRIHKRNEDYDLLASVSQEYTRQLDQLVTRYGFREADGPIIMGNRQVKRRR